MRAAIVNPASASGRTATRWRSIVSRLEDAGAPVEVQLTTGPGDAIAIVRRLLADGIRDFVVLGGDGTVGEVVGGCIRADGSGMIRDDVTLSIIHQGTGGDFARGLGIPKDETGAIAVAVGDVERRIDVGIATFQTPDGAQTRGFASVANIGMAAEVVQQVTGRLKRLGSNGSFAVATLNCLLRNRPRPVKIVTAEGLDADLDIVDIDVCNNRYMGGGMLVAPDALLDDGLFDVVLIGAAGRARLIRTFPKIYSGRHVSDPLVRVERTCELTITVTGDGPQEGVVLDGELVGSTPATFRVLESAITMRVASEPVAGSAG
jgi:YegS/Rv2252/BmrU family lipid kinase